MSDAKKGIKGWLLLPATGLIVAPILLFLSIAKSLSKMGTASFGEATSNFSGLSHLIIFEVLSKSVILFLMIFCAFLFFGKKPSTAKAIVALLLATMAFASIRFLWGISIFGFNGFDKISFSLHNSNILGAALSCAVWIPYFAYSKRVKNTFK